MFSNTTKASTDGDEPERPRPVATIKAFAPGAVIGDFELIRELGRGGTGVVWEAEQFSMKRRVALKLLFPHFVRSERTLQRFRREAEAGGKLHHSGIVQVYAVGVSEGVHYMAQELVPGGDTLGDALVDLRKQKALPSDYYREVADLFARIADALQAAHDAGVIHRDIKPSNILITDEEQPKIADFGLAKLSKEMALSHTGELAGTPFYMSPEQAAGKRIGIDHRTDIFSLGATLYEALTLRRPFDGDTSQQVLAQILLADPPDPQELRSKVPRDLRVICLKALEKRPERRYESMEAFAADLRRYLADEPITARPPSTLSRAVKWTRRHRVASVGAGIALLALIVVSGLLVEVAVERGRARYEARVSARALDFMVGFFEQSGPDVRGREVTAKEILDVGVDKVRLELADQPLIQARLLNTMGRVYHSLGDMTSAEPLLVQALGVHRRLVEYDPDLLLHTLKDLASLYVDQGRDEEAEPLFAEALDVCRQWRPDSKEQFATMTKLAALYDRQGRHTDARELLIDVLERKRLIFGDQHHSTLRSMTLVGFAFHREGRLDMAEVLLDAAVDEQAEQLGGSHPQTLDSLYGRALVHKERGEWGPAEALLAQVVTGRRRVLGADHPQTLEVIMQLARHHLEVQGHAQAEPLLMEAVDGLRRTRGVDDPQTQDALEQATLLLTSLERYDEARVLARELMEVTPRNDPRFDRRRELLDAIVERRQPDLPEEG